MAHVYQPLSIKSKFIDSYNLNQKQAKIENENDLKKLKNSKAYISRYLLLNFVAKQDPVNLYVSSNNAKFEYDAFRIKHYYLVHKKFPSLTEYSIGPIGNIEYKIEKNTILKMITGYSNEDKEINLRNNQ